MAVPWEELRWTDDIPHVVVNLSPEMLEQVEGFDAANWPAQPDFAAFEGHEVRGEVVPDARPEEMPAEELEMEDPEAGIPETTR